MEVVISFFALLTPVLAESHGIWEMMRSPRLRDDNYISLCSTKCSEYETCVFKNGTPTCSRSCPRSCSTRENPVCGSDGRTYTNRCLLKMRNCNDPSEITIVKKGLCASTKQSRKCWRSCNYHSARPMCGSDNITYRSYCEILQAACITGNKISFLHYGPCREDKCMHVRCPWGQKCKIDIRNGPHCVCNSDCPKDPSYVCGSNGLTYYNKCHLEAENCLTGKNIRLITEGECNTYDRGKRRIHRASVAFSPE